MKVRIKRFDTELPLPSTEPGAAGFDLSCREDAVIQPRKIGLVPVNAAIQVPEGYGLIVLARSSTSWSKGLMLANGIGLIDPFYSGDKDEIKVQFFNITDEPVQIRKGDQLVQGVLVRIEPPQWEEVESFGLDGHGGYSTAGAHHVVE